MKYENVTDHIMPSAKRLYLCSYPGLFFGKIMEKLKIRSKVQTGNIVAAHFQYQVLKRKHFEYVIFYVGK